MIKYVVMKESERSFGERVDWYLRREDTVVAKTLKRISPSEGEAYRNSHLKRGVEIAVATPMAVVATPIILGLGAASAIEDKGSAFYCDDRIGKHGEKIRVVKVRSMITDAELQKEMVMRDGTGKIPENDPRVTKVGRLARMFELDELPQLFQVILGRLALVDNRAISEGTIEGVTRGRPVEQRPKAWSEERLSEWLRAYFAGRPSLFSLWAACRQYKEDERRYHYDLLYSRKASLGLDLYIIYRTSARMFEKMVKKLRNSSKST